MARLWVVLVSSAGMCVVSDPVYIFLDHSLRVCWGLHYSTIHISMLQQLKRNGFEINQTPLEIWSLITASIPEVKLAATYLQCRLHTDDHQHWY